MGLCTTAATVEECASFQLLSEPFIIGAQCRSHNKSQVSGLQELFTEIKHAREGQGTSCGIQMNRSRLEDDRRGLSRWVH